jgi:sulfatase modifying factor 1
MVPLSTRSIDHPLAHGHPPRWASGWGQDRYGVFVEFSLPLDATLVTQRMRWLPPATFTMGSPISEAGRYDDEGPLHEVTISNGFWIFDTPCTQGLWRAVMPENPSRFPDDERPVEQVSWQDCQNFVERINELIPGLCLALPTESRWEYACRGGTTTATYAGEMEMIGKNFAPVLDSIAWYGGNSGVNFDLSDGWDSSDWSEKQYQHTRAGSRKVAKKKPNNYGLYDMLGNVWEWCEDGKRTYTSKAVSDPVGPSKPGAARLIRGGGWDGDARSARSASRPAIVPGPRSGSLGFRCVRVQAG